MLQPLHDFAVVSMTFPVGLRGAVSGLMLVLKGRHQSELRKETI